MRLGYACINTGLRENGIFSSHSVTMGTLLDRGPTAGTLLCKEKALQNLRDLLIILEWNVKRGIRLFRIGSLLWPHMGNHLLPPKFNDPYFSGNIGFAHTELKEIGEYARTNGIRLTFHMTPYLQLGSPNADILKRSIFDINMYGKTFAIMGMKDSVIILHGGGVYQTNETKELAKQKTLERWLAAFKTLDASARKCVAIENDERHYGVNDLLPFCEKNGIPFCLDVFHNGISADHVAVTPALLKRVIETWPKAQVPKFHLSEQAPGSVFGAHSDYVRTIPDYFFRIKCPIDLMIECKMKERAVLRLYKKYFKLKPGAKVIWIPKPI